MTGTAPLGDGDSLDSTLVRLELTALAGAQVVSGRPRSGLLDLGVIAGAPIGIWEMTPGVATDVESEEIFVVLSGRAVVDLEDGRALDLSPGSVVRLGEGMRTVWTVTETLRKLFIG